MPEMAIGHRVVSDLGRRPGSVVRLPPAIDGVEVVVIRAARSSNDLAVYAADDDAIGDLGPHEMAESRACGDRAAAFAGVGLLGMRGHGCCPFTPSARSKATAGPS